MTRKDDTEIPISTEVGLSIACCLGLAKANLIVAIAIGYTGFFDHYLMASTFILPGAAMLLFLRTKLGDANGIGMLILAMCTVFIVLVNFAFIGYGNVG